MEVSQREKNSSPRSIMILPYEIRKMIYSQCLKSPDKISLYKDQEPSPEAQLMKTIIQLAEASNLTPNTATITTTTTNDWAAIYDACQFFQSENTFAFDACDIPKFFSQAVQEAQRPNGGRESIHFVHRVVVRIPQTYPQLPPDLKELAHILSQNGLSRVDLCPDNGDYYTWTSEQRAQLVQDLQEIIEAGITVVVHEHVTWQEWDPKSGKPQEMFPSWMSELVIDERNIRTVNISKRYTIASDSEEDRE